MDVSSVPQGDKHKAECPASMQKTSYRVNDVPRDFQCYSKSKARAHIGATTFVQGVSDRGGMRTTAGVDYPAIQGGRHTYNDDLKQTDRQTDNGHTDRHTDRQQRTQTDRQTGRQIDRYTDRQTTDTQIDTQTDGYTDRQSIKTISVKELPFNCNVAMPMYF